MEYKNKMQYLIIHSLQYVVYTMSLISASSVMTDYTSPSVKKRAEIVLFNETSQTKQKPISLRFMCLIYLHCPLE